MKKVVLAIFPIILLGVCVYLYIGNQTLENNMKDTNVLEKKIKVVTEEKETYQEAIVALKEENKEKLDILAVWEKAETKLKNSTSSQ